MYLRTISAKSHKLRMRKCGVATGLAFWIVQVVSPVCLEGQTLDSRLNTERSRLLLTYSQYKEYGVNDANLVFNRLEPDRQAVFDSIVRALFQELERPIGRSTGKRPIDFLAEVHGIWGVRVSESSGQLLFRLSVKWRRGIGAALDDSDNFGNSINAHVLLPQKKGGDDNPKAPGKSAQGGKKTYRQKGHPSIQISFLENDETTGEVDIDYDEGWRWEGLNHCHTQPANSDVGSVSDKHNHLERFRSRFEFFAAPIQLDWSSKKHCLDRY